MSRKASPLGLTTRGIPISFAIVSAIESHPKGLSR